MEVKPREIEIYESADGKCPYTDWLDELDKHFQAAIAARINRVRDGNLGDCKPLKGATGIKELRIDKGPGFRVYFAEEGSKIIILLCGGDKSTQDSDIQDAQRYYADYLART